MEGKIVWKDKTHFTAINRGIESHLDASPDFGGQNMGPTPKELVLNGIAGCSGLDIVSILTKMRAMPKEFWIDINADKTTTTPSYFKSVNVIYRFKDDNVDVEKIKKAVNLSMTKYCGVSFMILKTCPITYEIDVNGKIIHKDQACFDLP